MKDTKHLDQLNSEEFLDYMYDFYRALDFYIEDIEHYVGLRVKEALEERGWKDLGLRVRIQDEEE